MLSLTVKKLDVLKFDGVAESDNSDRIQPLELPPKELFLKNPSELHD